MGFVDMLIARWHGLRRGDVVAIFLLAAFMGVLVIAAVIKLPGFTRTGNLGFGPDWECDPGNDAPHLARSRGRARSQRTDIPAPARDHPRSRHGGPDRWRRVVGQIVFAESGPRLLHLALEFRFTKVDAVKYELDVKLPFGLTVCEDLNCVPIGQDQCRVNYHCGFSFSGGMARYGRAHAHVSPAQLGSG